jgi:hypothetical protein
MILIMRPNLFWKTHFEISESQDAFFKNAFCNRADSEFFNMQLILKYFPMALQKLTDT